MQQETDELIRLHQAVLQAHLDGDVEALLAAESADYVVANRGEISHPSLEERRSMFSHYLGRTEFTEYRDLTEPIVWVSADGTLGWVIAQVMAKGVQMTAEGPQPLDFISAWIELYEKRDGRWWRTGNVSNFKT